MRAHLLLALLLTGCGTTYAVPQVDAAATVSPASPVGPAPAAAPGPARTRGDFSRVVSRVEPAAERLCRQENPGAAAAACDFRIVLDPAMEPNAYASAGDDGRPQITFAASLLPIMESDDEIAFVLSHEAGHHIAGHLAKQQQQRAVGVALGGLAAAVGAAYGFPQSDDAMQRAMQLGGEVGARGYGQTYELEADTLGAYIAARAGYNPQNGALFFQRPEIASDGGLPILVSHPASAQRQATVAAAWTEIQRQRAQGLEPTPPR